MTYHMFLDDERIPSQVTWVDIPRDRPYEVVRNFDEFVCSIETHGVPKFVSFDHDLADEHYAVMLKEVEAKFTLFVNDDQGGLNVSFDYGKEKTGYDCAKWLVEYCQDNSINFPDYQVHSMNPVGSERIRS